MTFWDFVNNHWVICAIAFLFFVYVLDNIVANILRTIQNIRLIRLKGRKVKIETANRKILQDSTGWVHTYTIGSCSCGWKPFPGAVYYGDKNGKLHCPGFGKEL